MMSDTVCHTKDELFVCSCTWTIDNFSQCPEKPTESLHSAVFWSPERKERKWQLELFPRGLSEYFKDYISLRINLLPPGQCDYMNRIEACILNSRGEKINKREGKFYGELEWGKFIKREILLDQQVSPLTDDKLSLHCIIKVVEKSYNIVHFPNELKFQIPRCQITQDMEHLLENKLFSDVTLCVDGQEFKAHKNILSARSTVFAAMFDHGMEENLQNRVVIEDLEPQIVRGMLRYIYTGTAPNLHKLARRMLIAADKYDLGQLKAQCEETLRFGLTVENAADLLMLADRHKAEQLKELAVDFVRTHAGGVMATPGWDELMVRRPNLLAEVCKELSRHQVTLVCPHHELQPLELTQRRCKADGPLIRPATAGGASRGRMMSDTICHTKDELFVCSCTWTIDNFSLRQEQPAESLHSAVFWSPERKERKWQLELFPRGLSEYFKDYISLRINLLPPGQCDYMNRIEACILNSRGEKINKREGQFHGELKWGKLIKREILFNQQVSPLTDDKLSLHCIIKVVEKSCNIVHFPNELKFQIPQCQINQDMEHLLENKLFSDVTLCVDGQEIKAHKNILSARSTVFAAMFDHGMEENLQNRVVIEDLEPQIVRGMLRYIYTGTAPNLHKLARRMLIAADKYDLGQLKAQCEETLRFGLTVENAADLLMLADRHKAEQLKELAVDFVRTHAGGVMATPGWDELMVRRPNLLAEVCKELSRHQVTLVCPHHELQPL
ncbi:SPOPL, partial [Cordylochernes scorpioides]